MQYQKIKPSGYFHRSRAKAGHDISAEQAEEIIRAASAGAWEIQTDGRERCWGQVSGVEHPVRVVTEATMSASTDICLIINAFRDGGRR